MLTNVKAPPPTPVLFCLRLDVGGVLGSVPSLLFLVCVLLLRIPAVVSPPTGKRWGFYFPVVISDSKHWLFFLENISGLFGDAPIH